MQAITKSMAVRFTQEDLNRMEKFIGAGYAMNTTDYIRRAVREQIVRDDMALSN